MAALERAIQLDPTHADAHFGRGLVHYYLEQYEEALAAYEHVIQLDPAHVDAHTGRGIVLSRLDYYE